MSDAFNASLRGAVDLSALNKKPVDDASPSPAIELQSLSFEITESNLRNYIGLTEQVPMVVCFTSDGDQTSINLLNKLSEISTKYSGSFVVGQIDIDTHRRVAEAFSVEQAGNVLAVIKGQPFPLFQGDQSIENISMVIDKLLEVAAGNGVTGKATVNESAEPVSTAAKLPPQHQEAVDALNAGEYQKANELYQKILLQSPADPLAAAGLAQTELLIRVDGLDFEKVLDNSPQNFEELMTFADALIAIGDFAVGFDALLSNYIDLPKENQEVVKERLLKYFEIVGKTDPTVVAARARLTSMLF